MQIKNESRIVFSNKIAEDAIYIRATYFQLYLQAVHDIGSNAVLLNKTAYWITVSELQKKISYTHTAATSMTSNENNRS